MKVSVITAVRNGAATLARTLQSVAAQRYAPLEHVIIDGASTDGTLDVVRRHVRPDGVLVSEPDAGVYDAFNKGLKHASGDFIGFLSCGDRYVDEHVIERLARETLASGAEAVFGDLAIVDGPTRVTRRRYRSAPFSPARVSYGYMPAHPTLLVRRSVFERFGGFDTSYRIAGDFEFVARAFARGGISYRYVPEVLVHMEDGGLSNRGLRSKWIITKEMRRACRDNGIASGWLRLLLRLPVKYFTERA